MLSMKRFVRRRLGPVEFAEVETELKPRLYFY